MPVYHIVLMKLRENITEQDYAPMKTDLDKLIGIIPGLQSVNIGPPLPISVHRNQGYDLAIVVVLDKPETVPVYSDHPEHTALLHYKNELSTDTLAFDFEF